MGKSANKQIANGQMLDTAGQALANLQIVGWFGDYLPPETCNLQLATLPTRTQFLAHSTNSPNATNSMTLLKKADFYHGGTEYTEFFKRFEKKTGNGSKNA